MHTNMQSKEISSSAVALLGELLDNTLEARGSVGISKFRADNYSMVGELDELEARGLIQRISNCYFVKATALPQIKTARAKKLISDIEKLYAVLRSHYRRVQESPILIEHLRAQSKISKVRTLHALRFMLDLSSWASGHTTDLSAPDAFVAASEGVLRHADFMSLVDSARSWNMAASPTNFVEGLIGAISHNAEPYPASPAALSEARSLGFEELLHPAICKSSLKQLRDGHLREAVMNAVIAVYDLIRIRTKLKLDGSALVTQAFGLETGKLVLSEIGTDSGDNDQKGFLQIYQGIYMGIRNPKAHTLDHDLDHRKAAQYLVMMSLLARRVDESKDRVTAGTP